MSIIQSLLTYLKTYPNLVVNGNVLVDHLGLIPTEYSIVQLPGDKIIENYINGSSLRVYPFAFQSIEYKLEDLERINTLEFYETLSAWFETQTDAGILPTLATGKTAESIEALQWGFLSHENQTTGIYQVQCRLTYKQV